MNLKEKLRKLRIAFGKLVLDRKISFTKLRLPPKKILFLRQDGKIGDYIVSSFVFREIKKQLPNIEIGVICSDKNAYLFNKNAYIDHCYIVRTRNILDYLKCGMKLANQKYDLVIDPTIALRNRDLLLLRVINAKHYIGYEKTNYQLFDFNIKNEKKHISTVYKRALELIGLNHIDISYDIPLNKDSHERIKIYLSESCLDSFIALNLFGASSTRSFNDNKIYELLEYLKKNTNKPILLLTFPAIARKLKKIACHFSEVFIYEHTKTVFDTIELIRFADLVISPDTSIVHIAVGLNKKLIAFYSLDEQNFIHWQPNNLVETHILRFEHNINEINISEIQAKWLN